MSPASFSGSSAVLRVYLVAVSTPSDRSRAFATVALAATLSIVAGPGRDSYD